MIYKTRNFCERVGYMKKNILKIILILGYFVPFVFLAMNEDAASGTLWFYLVMVFGFGMLCFGCTKTKSIWIVIVGNILSFLSSGLFTQLHQTEKWGYYFTPFSPKQLIILETVVVFVVQIVFFIHNSKKNQT